MATSNDLLDAKIAAGEARPDAKLAELVAEIRTSNAELAGRLSVLDGKIGMLPTKWTIIGVIVPSALGAVALVFAMLAYGGDLFGLGLSTHDVAVSAAQEAIELAKRRNT